MCPTLVGRKIGPMKDPKDSECPWQHDSFKSQASMERDYEVYGQCVQHLQHMQIYERDQQADDQKRISYLLDMCRKTGRQASAMAVAIDEVRAINVRLEDNGRYTTLLGGNVRKFVNAKVLMHQARRHGYWRANVLYPQTKDRPVETRLYYYPGDIVKRWESTQQLGEGYGLPIYFRWVKL